MMEDGKILLCRLCVNNEHFGKWTLPGGGNEFGESIQETLAREVLEETGLAVEAVDIIRTNSRLHCEPAIDYHVLQFIFSVNRLGGELRNETDGTTDLVEWVAIEEISPENSVDIVQMAVGLA